eukprot:COSAG04_NODE_744_length_10648_cov_52.358233_9_plen_385_part_00
MRSLTRAETLKAAAGRPTVLQQREATAAPRLQRAARGAVRAAEQQQQQGGGSDPLRYDHVRAAEHYPLNKDGAELDDVRAAYGFSEAWGTNTYNVSQQGPHSRSKNALAQGRQSVVLDSVVEPIADMLSQKKGAGSADEVLDRWHAEKAGSQDGTAAAAVVRQSLVEAVEATERTSVEGKTLRAVLCKDGVPEDVDEDADLPSKWTAERHFNELVSEGSVPMGTGRAVQRVSDEIIRNAVSFIMLPKNTSMYSWGFKKVKIGDRWEQIECLSRKRSRAAMWLDYDSTFSSEARLCRTSFYVVVKAITGKQHKSVTAIDYIVAETINSNQERLKLMISGEIRGRNATLANALIDEMEQVFRWVKNTHPSAAAQRLLPLVPATKVP